MPSDKITLNNTSGDIIIPPPTATNGVKAFNVKLLKNNIVDVDLSQLYAELKESKEQNTALQKQNNDLIESLEHALVYADKIAGDYEKLSYHLDKKEMVTPSPFIVIREMHNHLVEKAESAITKARGE